jgi:hypothetical protein
VEKAKVEQVLDEICQKIGGDWLLVGGALVQLHYNSDRATEDMDLVHISHPGKSKEVVQDELFRFTLKNWGMGPEFINLSVDFFVRQFKGWESELVLLREGTKGRIFRPSLTLFCALKASRGSELDLRDVKAALKSEGLDALDTAKLTNWLPPEKLEAVKALLK